MDNALLNNDEKNKIVVELNKRLPNIECPMCHGKQFIISDGYFNQPLQGNLNGISIGGPSMPSIAIICNKCGFMSQHALGALGLLPKNNDKNNL